MVFILILIILLVIYVVPPFTKFSPNKFAEYKELFDPLNSRRLSNIRKTYDFEKFHFELFEQPVFQNRVTQLKDAHTNILPFKTTRPIRSLRLRARPNDVYRFTQNFSLIVYPTIDPSKAITFRFTKFSNYVDYQIPDVSKDVALKGWLDSKLEKTFVFVTTHFNPLIDIIPEIIYTDFVPLPIQKWGI